MLNKFYCFIALSIVSFSGFAQITVVVDPKAEMAKQYLFENFAKGIVLMKNGAVENALLNYNTADQSIVFKQGENDILVLTGLEAVDTIYFHNKKFIPGPDGLIYEAIINNAPAVSLFVTYTNKQRPSTATADANGTSRKESAEVSNTMTGAYVSRPYKGDYIIEIQKNYWLIKSKQVYKATSEKQFEKVFPHKEDAIKKYIDDNHVNFKIEEDLVKLTLFCNTRM